MAKNISLLGADYPAVPAVVLPQTGGGSATFVDIDDMNDFEDAVAIVINGDTAPQAIASGQYLFIKNHSTLTTGGYHATSSIASGGAVSSSNVEADADGIANGINTRLARKEVIATTVADLANSVSANNDLIVFGGSSTLASSMGLSGAIEGVAKYVKNSSNDRVDFVAFNQAGRMSLGKIDKANSNAVTYKLIDAEKVFQIGGISNPTNLNNTALNGTYFAQDTACSNLPTANGSYYMIVCFGVYQIASLHSADGFVKTYTREYINDHWYAWTTGLDVIVKNMTVTVPANGSVNFTLPSNGVYLLDGNGTASAVNSIVYLIGGYTSASRSTVTNLTGKTAVSITATNTSALTFTASNSNDNAVKMSIIKLV